MKIKHLLITLLVIAQQVHAESWKDISNQSMIDSNQRLIVSNSIEKKKYGQFVVTYKDYIGEDFYGLNKLLVNCSNKTVRNLGGQYHIGDRPTNKGLAPNSDYVSKDIAPAYQLLYEEVCR